MDLDFIPLDQPALQEQVIAFLTQSYESAISPEQVGGAGMRMGEIPQALRDSPKNKHGATTVYLFDDDAAAYQDLIERRTENATSALHRNRQHGCPDGPDAVAFFTRASIATTWGTCEKRSG